jgi:imidazolonepropionase-like amidohydrolase
MTAIVEEAHAAGVKVAAHAIGDKATRIAAQAGADSIEHAYVVQDDVLQMMAKKHIYLVPTDGTEQEFLDVINGTRQPTPEERSRQTEFARSYLDGNRDRLRRALKFGVPIAAGSDMYVTMPNKNRGQASLIVLAAYAEEGMPPSKSFTPPLATPPNCWDGRTASARSNPANTPTSLAFPATQRRTSAPSSTLGS